MGLVRWWASAGETQQAEGEADVAMEEEATQNGYADGVGDYDDDVIEE